MREDLKELLEKAYPRGFFLIGLMNGDRGDTLFWDREGNELINEMQQYWLMLLEEHNRLQEEENPEEDTEPGIT